MGFNTGVLILNDAMHNMEQDPKGFVDNFMEAFHKFQRTHEPTDFALGNHVNGATVFHMAHADVTGVHAIGGNHTTKLYTAYNGGRHHTDADKHALLKALADEMGYTIAKKRKRKK